MEERFQFSGFADEIAPELEEQMRVFQQLGIRYIEMRGVNGRSLCDYSLQEAKEIKAQLKEHGFALSAIGSPIGKIGINDPFAPHLELFRHALDLAELFETPYIRMFSFFIPKGEDCAKYRDAVLERWGAFIEAAKGRGITLLHENEKEIYGDTAERCLDLLETLNCPYVRATFDPANFVQCGVEPYPAAYALLRPYIEYVHIKDAKFADGSVTAAGEGDGNVEALLRALWQDGYSGFLSLEPHLCDFSGFAQLEPNARAKAQASEGARLFTYATQRLQALLNKIEKGE